METIFVDDGSVLETEVQYEPTKINPILKNFSTEVGGYSLFIEYNAFIRKLLITIANRSYYLDIGTYAFHITRTVALVVTIQDFQNVYFYRCDI
jgi:subtilase family serine protease